MTISALWSAVIERLWGDALAARAAVGALVGRHRRWSVVVAVVASVLLVPALAWAGDDSANASNPWLELSKAKDDAGFLPSQYELSLEGGGIISDTGKSASAWLAGLAWSFYRAVVVDVIWLLDVVLGFKIVELVSAPFEAMSASINSVIDQIGVVPTVATGSILLSGFLLFRAKAGAAIGEMVVTTVITALLGTGMATPMNWVAGSDGLISQTQDVGVALSAEVLSGASSGSMKGSEDLETARTKIESRLLSTMVRRPHQLINYGVVIDGRPAECVEAYNKSLTQEVDQARDTVAGGCGEAIGEAAKRPSQAMLGTFVVTPAGLTFFIFVFVLLVVALVLTLLTLWEASKFVVELIKAILPGSSRLGVFVSAATILVCAFFLGLTVFGVVILLLLLDGVFTSTSTWPPAGVFIIADVVILAGLVAVFVYAFKVRKSGRKLGEMTGKGISSRPVNLPQAQGLPAMARSAAAPLMHMRASNKMRDSLTGARGGDEATKRAEKPAFAKRAASLGLKAGVEGLKYSVGAPVYAPRAAAAAKTAAKARKAALAAKIAAAKGTASDFGHEYMTNLGRAGRFAGRTAAAPGRAAGTAGRAAAAAARAVRPTVPAPMNGPAADMANVGATVGGTSRSESEESSSSHGGGGGGPSSGGASGDGSDSSNVTVDGVYNTGRIGGSVHVDVDGKGAAPRRTTPGGVRYAGVYNRGTVEGGYRVRINGQDVDVQRGPARSSREEDLRNRFRRARDGGDQTT